MAEPVRIPKDPEVRARLAQMAGLTDEERHAIDQWCYDQQREQDRRMGRDGIIDPTHTQEGDRG